MLPKHFPAWLVLVHFPSYIYFIFNAKIYNFFQYQTHLDKKTKSACSSGNMGNGFILVKVSPHFSSADRSTKIIITTLSDGTIQEIGIFQKMDHFLQLYDRIEIPSTLSLDLVGSVGYATTPNSLLDAGTLNYVLSPGSSLRFFGEVKDGIVALDFPNDQLDSAFEYESFMDGFTVLFVRITFQLDGFSGRIGLHKMGQHQHPLLNDLYSVFLLYVRDDDPPFKSGWNFMEYYNNPDPLPGEPSEWFGFISQDINDFFDRGYRWKGELTWL